MFLIIAITLGAIWLTLGLLMALSGSLDIGRKNWWEPIVVVVLGPIMIAIEKKEEIFGFFLNLIFFASPILIALVIYFVSTLFS